ncbi:MAG: preprotein translocase subunit YajC [Herbinix sp.]|nr:preprotein translocase subunit YajC [Herbinix sp.]
MSNFILLAAATGSSSGSWLVLVGELAFLGVIMYFLLIRPQKKQQRQLSTMLSTLAAGDSVVTASGFYGVVIDVMDEVVIVEFGNNKNCRIPMKKSAIVQLEKPNAEKNA